MNPVPVLCNEENDLQKKLKCAKKIKCCTFGGGQYLAVTSSSISAHARVLVSYITPSRLPFVNNLPLLSLSSFLPPPPFLSSPVPIRKAIKSSYGEILVIQEGQAERSRRESVKWMKPND